MSDPRILAAIRHYGGRVQTEKAIEEMAELTVALTRYRDGRGTLDDVRQEIADVAVMMAQLAELYGRVEVDEWIEAKLARLAGRIGGGT